jgi:hypothetical protein
MSLPHSTDSIACSESFPLNISKPRSKNSPSHQLSIASIEQSYISIRKPSNSWSSDKSRLCVSLGGVHRSKKQEPGILHFPALIRSRRYISIFPHDASVINHRVRRSKKNGIIVRITFSLDIFIFMPYHFSVQPVYAIMLVACSEEQA